MKIDHIALQVENPKEAAENTIRILPPLTVKKKEIDLAIRIIKKVCKGYK